MGAHLRASFTCAHTRCGVHVCKSCAGKPTQRGVLVTNLQARKNCQNQRTERVPDA